MFEQFLFHLEWNWQDQKIEMTCKYCSLISDLHAPNCTKLTNFSLKTGQFTTILQRAAAAKPP